MNAPPLPHLTPGAPSSAKILIHPFVQEPHAALQYVHQEQNLLKNNRLDPGLVRSFACEILIHTAFTSTFKFTVCV